MRKSTINRVIATTLLASMVGCVLPSCGNNDEPINAPVASSGESNDTITIVKDAPEYQEEQEPEIIDIDSSSDINDTPAGSTVGMPTFGLTVDDMEKDNAEKTENEISTVIPEKTEPETEAETEITPPVSNPTTPAVTPDSAEPTPVTTEPAPEPVKLTASQQEAITKATEIMDMISYSRNALVDALVNEEGITLDDAKVAAEQFDYSRSAMTYAMNYLSRGMSEQEIRNAMTEELFTVDEIEQALHDALSIPTN